MRVSFFINLRPWIIANPASSFHKYYLTESEATIHTPIECWCCIRHRVNLCLSSILAALSQSIDYQWALDWSLTVNDSSWGLTQQAKLRKAKRSTLSGLPHKRSGPEHDLTGWLDHIPPRFAFFRDIRQFSDGKKKQRYPEERAVQCVLHRLSLLIPCN